MDTIKQIEKELTVVFSSVKEPTAETHPQYNFVFGPFETFEAALQWAMYYSIRD